tara:strand:- start:96 stop:332 length:237 start_codon:yes stop_codon:yes gene_type:complete
MRESVVFAATAADPYLGLADLAAQEGADRQLIASTATSGVEDPRTHATPPRLSSVISVCAPRVRQAHAQQISSGKATR